MEATTRRNYVPGTLRYPRRTEPVEHEPRETERWIREARAIHISEGSCIDPRLRSVVSIFRVPNFLKELKLKAYVPQMVSLGPYHSNGSANLSGMEYQKKRALCRMSRRFKQKFIGVLDDMMFSVYAINEINEDADKIKDYYEEKIEWEPKRLAKMLTLDGCFILEILRTLAEDDTLALARDNVRGVQLGRDHKYEPIFEKKRVDFTAFDILNDLLILENQIPLIVLRKLLQLELNAAVDDTENFLFDVLVRGLGNKLYPFDYERGIRISPQRSLNDEAHLLGLLHILIVSPDQNDDESQPSTQSCNNRGMDNTRLPPAVKLSHAGIKFRRRDGGIKKIEFDEKKATMYLPPINVTDHTEVLFRNLIAYEVCKASENNYVTCYSSLMSNLIDTEKDVALLTDSKIIKNYLVTDSEVVHLFHGLYRGVTLSQKYVFQKLHNDVTKHYLSNFWKIRILRMEEDSTFWSIIACLAAICGLYLTFLQTYSTLFPDVNKRSL